MGTVGKKWRLDKTYIKVKVKWRYLYRAVDKGENLPRRQAGTVEFLLTIFKILS